MKNNDKEKAKQIWRIALKINPNNRLILKKLSNEIKK